MTLQLKKTRKGTLRRPVWRRQWKLASWAVIAALFLNIVSGAVLPGSSFGKANAAFPQADSVDVLVICTPNGFKLIYLDANGEPGPTEDVDYNSYCAFCLSFNKPILSTPSTATVISERKYKRTRQPFIRDAGQDVASVAFKPLGSRAPPTCS